MRQSFQRGYLRCTRRKSGPDCCSCRMLKRIQYDLRLFIPSLLGRPIRCLTSKQSTNIDDGGLSVGKSCLSDQLFRIASGCSSSRSSLRQHFDSAHRSVAFNRNERQQQLALRIRFEAGEPPDHDF